MQIACWLLSYSTFKDWCETRGLSMTSDLQSNTAFKLVFFKGGLAKNYGVKLEVSSHFSLLEGQKSGEQRSSPIVRRGRQHHLILPLRSVSSFTFLQLACAFSINKIQKLVINAGPSLTSCPFPSLSIIPIENLTWLGFPVAAQLWQHPYISSSLAYVHIRKNTMMNIFCSGILCSSM